MKKLFWSGLLAALLCLLFNAPVQATDSDGYIFRLTENVALLSWDDSSALPDGVAEVYAPEGLFRTNDAELIRELAEAGLLAYAEPDWIVTLLDVPDDPGYTNGTQWELSALHMDYAWNNNITGADKDGVPVRIGVVDSGVYTGHEDLAGARIVDGTNYCAEEGSSERYDISDSVGHGTFVTGILAAATGNGTGVVGLAPQVEIVPLKCFTAKSGRMSDVLAAIYGGVDDYQCQVLNMSFGVSQSGLSTTQSKALEEAIAHAAEKGVIIVAAVGNISSGSTGNDPVLYPAGYDTVIGVGAVDSGKIISSFSYQNESVFLTAPGEKLFGLDTSSPDAYTTGSGTSYAAPMVSAAAALALSVKPDMSPEEFMCLLRETAEDLGEPGWDTVYGYGMLNIGRLLEIEEKGWYRYEEDGEYYLSLRLEGLTPGSTVQLVQVVRNENGAQTGLFITAKTAAEDGSLWCTIPLVEMDPEGSMCVLTLDDDFCPLWEKLGWQGSSY